MFRAEDIRNRVSKAIERQWDKCEKAVVMAELKTFVQESYRFHRPVNVREAYWIALSDPIDFREVLDRADKSPFDPATSTSEILRTPTVAEQRYYRKRGVPVP